MLYRTKISIYWSIEVDDEMQAWQVADELAANLEDMTYGAGTVYVDDVWKVES